MKDDCKKYCVVAAGRAFTDIIAHVPDGFIESRGIPKDAGIEFDPNSLSQILSLLRDPVMSAGGTGANMAASIAALGGKAGYFGKVGHDEAGKFFLKDFEKRGVDLCCDPYVENGSSAVCLVILTEDGHRSFVTSSGCADAFTQNDFKDFDFSSTHFFSIDAELLITTSIAPLYFEVIEQAKRNTRIVVNTHNVRTWKEHVNAAKFTANYADVIIGNRDEYASLQEVVPLPSGADQLIVTTYGTEGVVSLQGGVSLFEPAIKPEEFVSSVGAGDAFMAGFLFGLSNNLNVKKSLDCGIQSAVAVLGQTEARPTGKISLALR